MYYPDMQPSTDDVPISVLYEDLLFKIFLENTLLDFDDVHHDDDILHGGTMALITARHCSQVSRQWRSIYLSSPSIWARLVNVEDLQWKTDDWRKEVISRTGEALLCVYGRVNLGNAETRDFVFPFLQKNWSRVQILLIIDQDLISTTSLADGPKMWAFLKEPAPQLQKIYIGISWRMAEEYFPATPSLFNNCAQRLKDFAVVRRAPSISWRRNLSSLSFSAECTTEELLKMLKDMPDLVSLSISNSYLSPEPNVEACPKVILPKLRMLSLRERGSFLNAGTILQCIKPSPDCCLYALVFVRAPGIDTGVYELYETGLASFSWPYLHPPSAVNLSFLPRSFILLQSGQRFAITLSAHSSSSSPSPSPLLRELISSATFSNVNTLLILQSESLTSPEALICILGAFHSATTLIVSDRVIQTHFYKLDKNSMSTLLPALVTLKICNKYYCPNDYVGKASPHEQFLKFRKKIGRPISVLDLGDTVLNNNYMDLDHFESEHTGLLVKWSALEVEFTIDGVRRKVEEYRCGDGHPERLRFATQSPTLKRS